MATNWPWDPPPQQGLLGTEGLTPEERAALFAQQIEPYIAPPPPAPEPYYPEETKDRQSAPEGKPLVIDDKEITVDDVRPDEAAPEPKPEPKPKDQPKVISTEPQPPRVIDKEPTAVDNWLLSAAAARRAEIAAEASTARDVATTPAEAAYAQMFQQAINGPLWHASARDMKEAADRLADEVFGGQVTGRPSLEDMKQVVHYRANKGTSPSTVNPAEKPGDRPRLVVEQLAKGALSTRGLMWAGAEAVQEATGTGGETAGKGRAYNNAIAAQFPEGVALADVKDFGDALSWSQQAALENLPSMASAGSGAVVGGLIRGSLGASIGAFGPSFLMETGSVQTQNKELDPDQKAGLATIAAGAAAGALDSVLPGKIGTQLIGRVGREKAEEIALRTLLLPTSQRIAAQAGLVGIAGAKGAAIESSTEALQQAIEEVGTAAETGTPIKPDLLWRMVEAGSQGAVLGGPAGAVGDVAEGAAARQAPIQELENAQFATPADQVATARLRPTQTAPTPEARPRVIAAEDRPSEPVRVRPTSIPVDENGEAQTFQIPSGPITSKFGPRHTFRTPNGNMASSNHAGVDIGLPSGTPVPAGASGVVVFAGKRGGYGNQVVIKFSDGTTASYSHLSRISAEAGDQVAQGAIVGRVGATGNATGPHLHLERRDTQGRPVNPMTGRMVRTSTTTNEDGETSNEDDTSWDDGGEYNNEDDFPWPQEEIDTEFENATGQTIAKEEGSEELTSEPSPPSTAAEPPTPVVQAVTEALADSPVISVEETSRSIETSLETAKQANPARKALAEQEQAPQPEATEDPVFAEDQQTVVGFVNRETGAIRPLEEQGPTASPDLQMVLAGLPKSQGAVLGPARKAGQSAGLGLSEPLDIATMNGSVRQTYEMGVREGQEALASTGTENLVATSLQSDVATTPEATVSSIPPAPQTPEPVASPDAVPVEPVAPLEEPVATTELPPVGRVDTQLDEIYDKLFDLETDGSKTDAKRYMQKLVRMGVLEQEDIDGLSYAFKDRDMGVEDVTSEIRTSVEVWADRERASARTKSRVVDIPYGPIEEPAADDFSFTARIARERIDDAQRSEGSRPARPQDNDQDGQGGLSGAAELEAPPVEADGTIILDHFSREGDLTETDPTRWGQHQNIYTRDERNYLNKAPPRTYFGIQTGRKGGYRLEFSGRVKYQTRVPAEKLYDVATDVDGLWVRGKPWLGEAAIKDAGYTGYWHKNQELGLVAVVFETIPVTPVATAATPETTQTTQTAPAPKKSQPSQGQIAEDHRTKARAYKQSIQERVLKIYADMGLAGLVPVEVVDSLRHVEGEAAGQYSSADKVIRIAAFVAHDIRGTARHEVIHWAVDNGVWNAEEWRSLKKWASAQPRLMAWARENYPKAAGYSEEDILEEAVAEGFSRWDQGRLQRENKEIDTVLEKLLQKLKDIIDALRAAFTEAGVTRGELREGVRLLAEFENGQRLAKLRKAEDPKVVVFGRRPWNQDLSREMLSGNISPEQHNFLRHNPGEKFQSGWHGSPKDNIAKFSLEYVGQGEGAQAFGWGLYFAEKKEVAEWYQRKLTMDTKDPVDIIIQVNGQSIREWGGERFEGPYGIATYEVADRLFSFLTTNKPYNGWLDALQARADNDIDGWVAKAKEEGNTEEMEDLLTEQRKIGDLFTALAGQNIGQKAYASGGKLYKVEVPENEDLIDLDKPLKDQSPKVKAALATIQKDLGENLTYASEPIDDANFWELGALTFVRVILPNMVYNDTGPVNPSEELENAMVNGHSAMATSIWLRDAGIAGSRYLDRDSRVGAEPGEKLTANFVIFDDNHIELKAKYRVIDSQIVNSPLSDPTIPDPGIFRRIHDQTMGLLGALAGKDVDAADNLIDAFRRKVTQRYQQVIKTQRRVAEQIGVDRLDPGMNPMEMITADERGYKLQFLTDNMIKPMAMEMSRRGVSMDDLGLYLYARHAPARNARIAVINKEFHAPDNPGSGMKDTEAQQIMTDFATDGKLPDLQAVAQHIDAMIEYAQQERIDGGLLSTEDVAKGFQPGDFYVPLRGNENIEPELEMDFALATRKGGGFSISGKEGHRMFGRASRADLEQIVGYTITQAQEAVDRSYRNKVAQNMLAMFRAVPDPQFVQIDRVKRVAVWNRKTGQVEYQMQTRVVEPSEQQRTIYVKTDGDVTKMTFNDSNPSAMRFVKAAKNLGVEKLHRFLQLLSLYTRVFTKSNTQWNVDFILANAAKDIQTGVVNASTLDVKGLRRAMVRNLLSLRPLGAAWMGATHGAGAGFKSSNPWHQTFAEFEANGGKLNYGQVEPIQDALKTARREIRNAGRSAVNPIRLAGEAVGWIDRANSAFENMTRLAAYKALRDHGIEAKRAAEAVRELTTNFQQHGEWGPKFNAAYGFANASMIGGARFAYTIIRKPYLAAGLIAIGMLEDLLNSLWDDDEWDSYTEEDKNANYFILLPQAFGFDLKVPAGYGVNAFITTGRKMSELWRGKMKADGTRMSVMDAASDVGWSFYNAFSPVSGHTVFNVAAPTIFDPIVDIYQNQDNWGRPIMPPQAFRKEQQKPDSQLAFENTSQFWKTMATTMNAVGGGNEIIPGWTPMDISPESYKHMVEQTVGGAGRALFRTLGLIEKTAEGEQVGPNDIPIVRRFAGTPYGAKNAKDEQLSAFYDRLNTSRVVIAHAKEMQARFGHDSPQYQAFRKDNEPIINFHEKIDKAEKLLRAYNTAENAAERGAIRAEGLKRRDRKAIFKVTKIVVPASRPLTDEEVAKIKGKIKEKKAALAQRFNELYLADVMDEK